MSPEVTVWPHLSPGGLQCSRPDTTPIRQRSAGGGKLFLGVGVEKSDDVGESVFDDFWIQNHTGNPDGDQRAGIHVEQPGSLGR